MEYLVTFNQNFKDKMDALFKEKTPTYVDIALSVKRTDLVVVPHIGRLSKREAEYAYESYGDRMDYMMSNDGMTPEDVNPDYYIKDETAKAIVKFYTEEDGVNRTLVEMARYLYKNGVLKFRNVNSIFVKELSAKHVHVKTNMRLNRPRFYKIINSNCQNIIIIQPNRRKNEFFIANNDRYIIFDLRLIVDMVIY